MDGWVQFRTVQYGPIDTTHSTVLTWHCHCGGKSQCIMEICFGATVAAGVAAGMAAGVAAGVAAEVAAAVAAAVAVAVVVASAAVVAVVVAEAAAASAAAAVEAAAVKTLTHGTQEDFFRGDVHKQDLSPSPHGHHTFPSGLKAPTTLAIMNVRGL